jgi:hypothetical protein
MAAKYSSFLPIARRGGGPPRPSRGTLKSLTQAQGSESRRMYSWEASQEAGQGLVDRMRPVQGYRHRKWKVSPPGRVG